MTSPAPTLQQTAAEFGLLLTAAGWQVSTHTAPLAVRVEGALDDAAAMVTHKVGRRHPRRFYILHPAIQGLGGWREVHPVTFEHFASHLELPLGTRGKALRSPCSCGKVRYLTEQRATAALLDVKVHRALAGEARAECRAYRCEDDQRVWHLTRRAHWYPAPKPAGGAL